MNQDHPSNKGTSDSLEAEVKEALRQWRRDHFAAGFEDRALARWTRERLAASSIFALIERRAVQLLPLAIAASLFLAVYSARQHTTTSTTHASLLARTLGWTDKAASASTASASFESVYSTLYGLPALNSAPGMR